MVILVTYSDLITFENYLDAWYYATQRFGSTGPWFIERIW